MLAFFLACEDFPLTVVLPQIFFNLTTLFFYTVFFCLFSVPLMLSFISLYFSDPSGSNLFLLSSLLLSHRSRISAVTQVFSFFLLMIIAKDLTGCFSYCCVEDMIIESMSASSLFMMVRGANFPPTIAWKVSNTLGSFSFPRST